jgi:putative ABC transport system substrate-binding protein
MQRRDFIKIVAGSVVTWPLAARAQQPAMPVVGFLNLSSPDAYRLRAFHQGLKEVGFVEGENVTVEYRWADNQPDRLQTLAAELVRRRVTLIVAGGGFLSGLAAKTETKSIPVLFVAGDDPVKLGLVTSLAKPDGNLTGVNILVTEVVAKRLELLRELLPKAIHIGVLADPANAETSESMLKSLDTAARRMGMQIHVFKATTIREIDAAFTAVANERPDALFVGVSPFLLERRVQLAQLAARHAIPAIYQEREHAEVGGLMSYGASIGDAYRQLGVYAGRVLKGAKPADLPVVQSSKLELVINHSTARMLGLTVPPTLFSIADEVIE